MDTTAMLTLPLRYRPWRPRHVRLVLRDLLSAPPPSRYNDAYHLRSAIEWLCRAQDVRNDKPDAGGVSAGWSFEDGWLPSYPETSGYIVETFIAAARTLDGSEPTKVCSRLDLFQTGITSTPCCAAMMQACSCALAWCANRSPVPTEYLARINGCDMGVLYIRAGWGVPTVRVRGWR